MSDDGEPPSISGIGVDLPATLHIAGLAFTRTESPPSLACWTGCFPESAGGNAAVVSLVIEPAAPPEEVTLQLAHDVVSRFDVFVGQALRYCRTRLRERHFELTPEELSWLDLPELPLAVPEAVVWADQTWAIRFTENRLRLADPYGILVTFDGTQPVDVQGIEDEQ
ncbi:hypothetical protein P1S61_16325 [Streptomyces sp. ME08-AFT2]|uniref:hypothetical protein n=1 Tax=Streptomyces sp. ME08-AFT2 TaxID=3028683 RepID=UPI0029ACD5A1|nr:hypothetical protein [Streptomyces sp. ME08-AFT2]MDX3310614.1 hypothetical protein [Streptomyces sp. ME08-AFT2]